MGILLYIIAVLLERILTVIFMAVIICYYLFSFQWKTGFKRLSDYYLHLALALDQLGNVKFKVILNKFLIKKYHTPYFFGDEDDTISYAIGMNLFKHNTNKLGSWIAVVLNKIEKRHVQIAINKKIEKDIEGLKRLEQAGLIRFRNGRYQWDHIDDYSFTNYVDYVSNSEQ